MLESPAVHSVMWGVNYIVVLTIRALETWNVVKFWSSENLWENFSPSLSLYEGRKSPEVSRELPVILLNETKKGR